jgi:hypothetical protein
LIIVNSKAKKGNKKANSKVLKKLLNVMHSVIEDLQLVTDNTCRQILEVNLKQNTPHMIAILSAVQLVIRPIQVQRVDLSGLILQLFSYTRRISCPEHGE